MHAQRQQRSTDLHKPSFLALEWSHRLLPDALGVVDDDLDPIPASPDHSCPITLAVLHPNEVLAKLEPLTNFFLDHREAECLPCSWVLLSQLIGRVLLETLLLVIFVLGFSSLGFIFVLEISSLGFIVLYIPFFDGYRVEPIVV